MLQKFFTVLILFTMPLFAQTEELPIIAKDKIVQKAADYYNKQQYDKAADLLEDILDKNDNNAEAYFVLSKVLFKQDELGDAIDAAEEAVELNPDNVEYRLSLVNFYSIDIRDASIFRAPSLASSIKEELLTIIKLDPNNADARSQLSGFYLRAPGIMGGDNDKALEQANILLKLDEKRGRFALANIYTEKGDLKKVENEYKILDEKFGNDPEFFGFYNTYGYFLLNQNRLDEAIEKFKKQVALAPNNANAHDSLGEGYLKKGMLKESLAEYQKALELNPKSESAKNKIAEIKDKM